MTIHRTPTEQAALDTLKTAIASVAEPFLSEAVAALAGAPEKIIDVELRRLGHGLFMAMKAEYPHLEESVQVGLPFAFIELARDRIKLTAQAGRA